MGFFSTTVLTNLIIFFFFKHGLQLKGNYLAMKKKIDAVKTKELLKESTTIN